MRAVRCFVAAILAAGIVTMVAAQPGGRQFGGGGTDIDSLVFTNTALQEEIKVTDAQKEKIKPVADKIAALEKKRSEARGGKGKFDKDKAAELREEATKVAEERKKVYDDVFTADQKKRLKQIKIQVMTFRVFDDPEAKAGKGTFGRGASDEQKALMKEVQEALKLTDSQKSSIKGISADYSKESQAVFRESGAFSGGKIDQDKLAEATKKIEKLRKEAWTKVEEVFDADQKKTWKSLTGDAFDTSKLRTPRRD